MKILKKVLSVILIVILCCTSVPLKGFAQNMDKKDDLSFESTAPLGTVLADTLEEANSQEDESSASFGVSNVYVEENKVFVDLYTAIDCKIVLAVYNEDTGVMIHTDNLSANTETTELNFDISNLTLPEYYYIKIFMLGENNEPLCTQYEYLYGTRKYQEFFAKTVEDFDQEYVIQLSDDKTNNFLVVNPDSIKIDGADGYNKLTSYNEERGIYTFENIEEEIKNLKEDDVLYFSSDNIDEIVVIKVGSVKVKGDEAVVHQKKTELSDVFEYVKLEDEAFADDSSFQKAELGTGVELVDEAATFNRRDIDINASSSFSKAFSWKFKNIIGTGKISVGLKTHIYYDIKWGDKDFLDIDLKLTIKLSKSLTLSGSIDAAEILDIFLFKNLPITIFPGVNALVGVAPVIECSMSLTAEINLIYTVGFSYLTDIRCLKYENCSLTPNFVVNSSVTFKFGLKCTVGIELIEALQLKLSGEGGKIFTGTVELYSANKSEDVIHECKACLVGEAKTFFSTSVVVEAGIDELNLIVNLVNVKWDFNVGAAKSFYRSLTDEEYIGWGKCPNVSYKVAIFVKDENGDPIKGAYVQNSSEFVDENGMAYAYLKKGYSDLFIYLFDQGIQMTRRVNVNESTKAIEIRYNLETGETESDNPYYPDEPDNPDNSDEPEEDEKIDFDVWVPDAPAHIRYTALNYYSPDDLDYVNPLFERYHISYFLSDEIIELLKNKDYEGEVNVYIQTDWCINNEKWNYDETWDLYSNLGFGFKPDKMTERTELFGLFSQFYRDLLGLEEGQNFFDFSNNSLKMRSRYFVSIETLAGETKNIVSDWSDVQEVTYPGMVNYNISSIPLSFEFESLEYVIEDRWYGENTTINYSVNWTEELREAEVNLLAKGTGFYSICYVQMEKLDGTMGEWIRNIYYIKDDGWNNYTISLSPGGIETWKEYEYKNINIIIAMRLYNSTLFHSDGSFEITTPDILSGEVYFPKNETIYKSYVNRNFRTTFKETIENAIKDTSYVIYVVKDKNAKDVLSKDNLLFVDQKVAEDTELTFEFNLENPNQEYDVIFVDNKLEHTHSYSVLYQEWPTCNRAGSIVSRCTCGDEQRTEIPALGHYYDSDITPATCVSSGYTTNTCISCGNSYIYDETTKLPHSLSNWYTTKLVTCEVDGTEERKCWNCEYTETQVIPAKGHDFEDGDCKNCKYDCNCNCHKSGIAGFFFKLILFFQKIFKQNKYCSGCGIAHY